MCISESISDGFNVLLFIQSGNVCKLIRSQLSVFILIIQQRQYHTTEQVPDHVSHADAEGRQRVDSPGLPARGRAPDRSPARAHRPLLRSVYGRGTSRHGVRVHASRRPQPFPQVRSWGFGVKMSS